jgi:hypothetical protein
MKKYPTFMWYCILNCYKNVGNFERSLLPIVDSEICVSLNFTEW